MFYESNRQFASLVSLTPFNPFASRTSLLSFPLQLSQSATSIDNRVPTPASVAELSTQQALPDMSSTEAKPHIKEEDDDFGKKQTDVKMEVSSEKRHFLHRVLDSFGGVPV